LLAIAAAVILRAIDSIHPNPRLNDAASLKNAKKFFKNSLGISCALLAFQGIQ
jgi:hypothetical protein